MSHCSSFASRGGPEQPMALTDLLSKWLTSSSSTPNLPTLARDRRISEVSVSLPLVEHGASYDS